MSSTSKFTMGTACVVTLGIIGYVHYKQQSDRNKLHEGVVRDVERQKRRKAENLYTLQQQLEIAKHLKNSEDSR